MTEQTTDQHSTNTTNDDQIGALLTAALPRHIDQVLATPSNLTASTIMRAAKKEKTRKRAYFAVGTLGIAGLGTTGAVQLADRTSVPKQAVVQSNPDSTPHYLLRNPNYNQISFNRFTHGPALQFEGASASLFVNTSTVSMLSENATTKITIGESIGTVEIVKLDDVNSRWTVEWRVGNQLFVAVGDTAKLPTGLAESLATARYDEITRTITMTPPRDFSLVSPVAALPLYQLEYQSPTSDDRLFVTLNPPPPPGMPLSNAALEKKVSRGNRMYTLDQMVGPQPHKYQNVRWTEPEGFVVSLSASALRPLDDLLDIADQVVPATSDEWKKVQVPRVYSAAALVDGSVGATNWKLQAGKRSNDTKCQTFELMWEDKRASACINDSAARNTFRALEIAHVGDASVVFGAIPLSSDDEQQVIRIVDDSGNVLATELALDDNTTGGQVFAISIPNTLSRVRVEIHNFNRDWYQQADDASTDGETPLLEDGSAPVGEQPVVFNPSFPK
jgi:hypothetical protein